jgi:hypothetical protein
MERKPIRIQYGLPEPAFLDFLEKECPHAGVALGGCVVDESHPSQPAYVCSDCDALYAKWRAEADARRAAALKTITDP